jgi:valyl-tRNA synthetase
MRMRGKAVFYPVGWDDNGLPTERRVQNHYGVRCDPALPYQPGLEPPGQPGGRPLRPAEQLPVSRRNFTELCQRLTADDEAAYATAWRQLGLSVDWELSYRTIDDRARAVSQRAFLADLAAGDAYQAQGPALWDVTFGTAVAQAETEDRPVDGSYVKLAFRLENGGTESAPDGELPAAAPAEVVVATTRPELLAGCVALVAHPGDERYAGLIGTSVRTPLFGVPVPVLAHRLADPETGTGLVMVCTFGDATDVIWWRELHLPIRPVIGRDGRVLAQPPAAISGDAGRAAYAELAGRPVTAARRKITELLAAAGALRGEPAPVRHAVKFYEKGDRPLEIITTRQWFIRNGSRDPGLRDSLRGLGRELDWHPAHMRSRYENWVDGLTGDWLVSRQRFAGVPVPAWYPLDAAGLPDRERPILPADADLPVDPSADTPAGFQPGQRDVPGGFTADPDVMDTWATSSLSPQIAADWGGPGDLMSQVYPMDLRPQAHEIIRTWLFYSVLRSRLRGGGLPWRHAAISGWIVDPDRKKMSKSAGNVMTPEELFERYGTDAVRYWAASARLGVDTIFDPAMLRVGRRLAVKILNASRFVLGLGEPGLVTEPADRALLRRLAAVSWECTLALDDYEHAVALEHVERFFWFLCDDYLELVKVRGYGEFGPDAAGSAAAALRTALSAVLRLLAPYLPFVTEEVWSWWRPGSVHLARWPDPAELLAMTGDDPGTSARDGAALDAAVAALTAIRRAKSQAGVAMKAPVAELILTAPQARLSALDAAARDVRAAGKVERITLRPAPGAEPAHEVLLA